MGTFFASIAGTSLSWEVCLVRILLSFLAGSIMGLERKFRMRFVGIRTLVLICVSSCVIMLLSIYLAQGGFANTGDPARLAAQVVSGIGFLGGGAILREGFNVKGLTSAAIIWTAAALGLAVGAGFIFPALVALVLALLALVLIEFLEELFFPAEELKVLFINCGSSQPELKSLKRAAARFGIVVTNITGASFKDNVLKVSYEVRIPKSIDFHNFARHLSQEFDVVSVELR